MALRAEFMLQDRRRYEAPQRNFGGDNSRAQVERGVMSKEPQPQSDRYREEKPTGKQKVVENKEVPKPTNSYARPTPGKCFKCNQPGHRSNECPLRKAVHLVEREEGEDNEVYCEPDGDEEYEKDNKDEEEGQNYLVQRLMLALKQEDST